MKLSKYIYAVLFALIFVGCDDDDASNPAFADDELPKIFIEWSSSYVYKQDQTITFSPQVSPSDNISCQWTVNGEVVSTNMELNYTITDPDPFMLKFEVTRNGKSTSRTANVEVIKRFVAKEYDHVVMGVLTTAGTSDFIQWNNITHLMITSLVVNSQSAELNLPDSETLNRLKTIIALAHNQGVYVIMDISGGMNLISGVGAYGDLELNKLAINPDLRAQYIANLQDFITEYELDGVNISMNSANNPEGTLLEHQKIADFMTELRSAFPSKYEGERGQYFVTASIPMAWNNDAQYGYLGVVEGLDWVNLMLFGATDLSPTQHAANWQIGSNVGKFKALGIPVNKMLVGIGAFGVKYDIPPGTNPTWGNIDNFLSYPTYAEILSTYSGAETKDYIEDGNAKIFYTGVGTNYATNVASKAGEAKVAGVKGMFIWTLDYDSKDQAKSLTKATYSYMNP